MSDFILTLSYARNAEGKIDPEEGSILTGYPVPEEIRKPGMKVGEPAPIRLTADQTAAYLGLTQAVLATLLAQEAA